MDIDRDCPLCGSQLEDIDHLFRQCLYTTEVWNNLSGCVHVLQIPLFIFRLTRMVIEISYYL